MKGDLILIERQLIHRRGVTEVRLGDQDEQRQGHHVHREDPEMPAIEQP